MIKIKYKVKCPTCGNDEFKFEDNRFKCHNCLNELLYNDLEWDEIKCKMYLLDAEFPIHAQLNKVREEVVEFLNAIDKENRVEEFFDTIQSMLGVLEAEGLIDKLEDGLKKHNKKLTDRGWILKNL